MDPVDAADQIQDVAEDERGARQQADRFKTRAAIVIATLAMLLALASLGGDNATKDTINSNIQASDTYAFYQAKNVRQTSNQLAADALEAMLVAQGPALSSEAREDIQGRIDRYKATVARYDSEPDPAAPSDPLKGEGKKELLARAQSLEARRDRAQAQDPNFDSSTALYQIAIVLGSVSIVAASSRVLLAAIGLGVVATVLMLNGFFLLFPLPFG
jgi:hypothetical protein